MPEGVTRVCLEVNVVYSGEESNESEAEPEREEAVFAWPPAVWCCGVLVAVVVCLVYFGGGVVAS